MKSASRLQLQDSTVVGLGQMDPRFESSSLRDTLRHKTSSPANLLASIYLNIWTFQLEQRFGLYYLVYLFMDLKGRLLPLIVSKPPPPPPCRNEGPVVAPKSPWDGVTTAHFGIIMWWLSKLWSLLGSLI